ncbi:MAG: ArsR/SmtB family transcription factor [Acidiferrobacterales bacterium]
MKAKYAESLPESWAKFARFFSALGDPTRQKILLVFESNEEICVNEIARLFKLSRPAISHHLRVLRNAELLLCEKRGKEVYYRVNYPYCVQVLKLVHGFVASKVNGEEAPSSFRPEGGRVFRQGS